MSLYRGLLYVVRTLAVGACYGIPLVLRHSAGAHLAVIVHVVMLATLGLFMNRSVNKWAAIHLATANPLLLQVRRNRSIASRESIYSSHVPPWCSRKEGLTFLFYFMPFLYCTSANWYCHNSTILSQCPLSPFTVIKV